MKIKKHYKYSLLSAIASCLLLPQAVQAGENNSVLKDLALRCVVRIIDAIPNMVLLGGGAWFTIKMNLLPKKQPMNTKEAEKMNFKDYVGSVPKEVTTVLDQIKNPIYYRQLKVNPPHGILLYGPPGTGKTLLARCLAGELQAPFFPIKASDVTSKYISQTSAGIRKLFEDAQKAAQKSKNKTAVIFIDEIDSLCSTRGDHKFYDESVTELLTQMDGLENKLNHKKTHIIVVGATNRKDSLDEAILRAGRFDYKIEIPNPAKTELTKIGRFYVNKRPHTLQAKTLVPRMVEKITSTSKLAHIATPAEINGVIEDACRIAASNSRGYLSGHDIEEAFFRKTQTHILPDAGLKGLQYIASDFEEQPNSTPLCYKRSIERNNDLR